MPPSLALVAVQAAHTHSQLPPHATCSVFVVGTHTDAFLLDCAPCDAAQVCNRPYTTMLCARTHTNPSVWQTLCRELSGLHLEVSSLDGAGIDVLFACLLQSVCRMYDVVALLVVAAILF